MRRANKQRSRPEISGDMFNGCVILTEIAAGVNHTRFKPLKYINLRRTELIVAYR